ncbi:hypothetical protein AGMMS50293_28760 [Spirochaetia bacterium]|nr:hypothetical protein AGMMS50293_28760 [Spirochaetia bacterium]
MKKFIVTIFILIILGGTAFFFGWAQFTVPPGAYGVVRSKTHGVDQRLIRSGEFRWIWYKLIPTNVEITVLRLEPVSHSINVKNSLPSGASYASFAGIPPAGFSWELNASLSFSLNPDTLVSLVADNNIGSQEALDAYQKGLAEKIEGLVLRRLGSAEISTSQLEELLKSGSNPELEQEINREFPAISDVSLLVKSAQFPDFALYTEVRGLYDDFLARQRQYVSAALNQKAESRIDAQLRFDELEHYGELLMKYPILLEYLALERGELRNRE